MVLCGWLAACGIAPFSLAPRAPLAYIANSESDSVTVLDTASDTVVATIAEIKRPWDVRASPDGKTVYVGGEWRTVAVIDAKKRAVVHRLEAGQASTSLSLSFDGRALYVADVKRQTVSVFSTATRQLLARASVGPMPMAIVPTPFPKYYVASYYTGTVKVVSIFENRTLASIPVGEFPIGMAVSPDGLHAYVTNQRFGTVSVIDTRVDQVVATIEVEGNPTGIAVSPDGRKIYVTNKGSDTISVIDAATHHVTATLDTGGKDPTGIVIAP